MGTEIIQRSLYSLRQLLSFSPDFLTIGAGTE